MDNSLSVEKGFPTSRSNSDTNSSTSESNVQKSNQSRMVEDILPAVDGGYSRKLFFKTL